MSFSGTDVVVILSALGAIALVNWYFFVAGRAPATATAGSAGAPAEVVITVDGGYSPSTVRVAVGAPVRLVFDRRDDSSCSEEIVIPDFGVRRFLPTGEKTVVEITPSAAGTYSFTCGMSMLRGTIVADD
jgi:plastocyanin domain-containing protein